MKLEQTNYSYHKTIGGVSLRKVSSELIRKVIRTKEKTEYIATYDLRKQEGERT